MSLMTHWRWLLLVRRGVTVIGTQPVVQASDWARALNLGIDMNIEFEEVVVQDVTDEALELASGGAQGGRAANLTHFVTCGVSYC